MSVTYLVIKKPQDQKTLDLKAVPEFLNEVINGLAACRGGNAQAGTSVDVLGAATYASATATTSAGNFAAADTVTVAGTAFTAVVSGPTSVQFAIGANSGASAANLAAAVNAHPTASRYVVASATGTTTGVATFTASQPGPLGNLVTLAKSSANTTLSGAVLSGGNTSAPTVVSF